MVIFLISLGVINDRLGSGHRVLRHTNRRWSCKHAVKIFEARAFERQLGNPILGYLEASTSFPHLTTQVTTFRNGHTNLMGHNNG